MRIVQINENRTDKPVVVKKIKSSCSAHLSGVSATSLVYFCVICELRQCTNIKSNSSGGGPHRPWRNVDSERTSTPRLRLGVLASLLVNIALELHSVVHRRLHSIVDSVGIQVQLGCASLYLPPPHQQCSEVVLGVHQTPMQC